ncbi:MAG: alanine racemase [Actinomycetes bacterium]
MSADSRRGEAPPWRQPGFVPGGSDGLPADFKAALVLQPARAGLPLLLDLAESPLAILRESALLHNVAAMNDICDSVGFSIAPHAKTTMSPELIDLQTGSGAWGFAAATSYQVRRLFDFGVTRVICATELVDVPALVDILQLVAEVPDREFLLFVDSFDTLRIAEAAAEQAPAGAVLQVLVEVGHLDGRTGIRGVEGAIALAEAAAASPSLVLRGIAGYEATVPGIRTAEGLASVDEFLDQLALITRHAFRAGWLSTDPILTVGGSMYIDRVQSRLAALPGEGIEVVLRSGCYLTHDHGLYETASQITPASQPQLQPEPEPQPRWQAAVEVWARVISRPEPDLAILNAGRRDLSHDQGLPTPVATYRNAGEVARTDELTAFALSDQHTFVRLSPGADLRVGDLVALGISHPCTTFDKWRVLHVVDDDYRSVGVCTTHF